MELRLPHLIPTPLVDCLNNRNSLPFRINNRPTQNTLRQIPALLVHIWIEVRKVVRVNNIQHLASCYDLPFVLSNLNPFTSLLKSHTKSSLSTKNKLTRSASNISSAQLTIFCTAFFTSNSSVNTVSSFVIIAAFLLSLTCSSSRFAFLRQIAASPAKNFNFDSSDCVKLKNSTGSETLPVMLCVRVADLTLTWGVGVC